MSCPKCHSGYRLRTDEKGVMWSRACDCPQGKAVALGDEKIALRASRDARRNKLEQDDEWAELRGESNVVDFELPD